MENLDTLNYPIEIIPAPFSRLSEVDFTDIPFGKVYSDHMFIAEYEEGEWQKGSIEHFKNISVPPSISALHYGQIIFEGLKANKQKDGTPAIFRPLNNWQRMNESANRLAMPEIPKHMFMAALKELVKVDKDWIPTTPGSALYIRPFMFATEEYIGIRPSTKFTFIIFTCPVGSYYPKPVKVMVSEKYVRAFKGGTGFAKAAGNYAATMQPIREARELGYDQLLWLDGCNFDHIHEIGTMNVFFQIDDTIITPSVEDGEILAGVTRLSAIQLLKDKGLKVEERKITIQEIVDAYESGELKDAFGTGTAATVAHISDLGYQGKNMELPSVEKRKYSNDLKKELEAIKTGNTEDRHNWLYRIDI